MRKVLGWLRPLGDWIERRYVRAGILVVRVVCPLTGWSAATLARWLMVAGYLYGTAQMAYLPVSSQFSGPGLWAMYFICGLCVPLFAISAWHWMKRQDVGDGEVLGRAGQELVLARFRELTLGIFLVCFLVGISPLFVFHGLAGYVVTVPRGPSRSLARRAADRLKATVPDGIGGGVRARSAGVLHWSSWE